MSLHFHLILMLNDVRLGLSHDSLPTTALGVLHHVKIAY